MNLHRKEQDTGQNPDSPDSIISRKPFPKEEELNQKLERLSELNALLNMDEREDTEAERSEPKEERPARGSIHEKLQIYKEKSQRESENGRENRNRDFGLE